MCSILFLFNAGCHSLGDNRPSEHDYEFLALDSGSLRNEIIMFNKERRNPDSYPYEIAKMYVSNIPAEGYDTLKIMLVQAVNIQGFLNADLEPVIDYMYKIGDIIVGVVDNTPDKKGSITKGELLNVLKRYNLPEYRKFVKDIRKGYHPAGGMILDHDDEWTLKFVNDSLVYKEILITQ